MDAEEHERATHVALDKVEHLHPLGHRLKVHCEVVDAVRIGRHPLVKPYALGRPQQIAVAVLVHKVRR